ncbi:sensor histidine kinase [Enterovibrio norvegicus]|uniref:histidine kinase n=1 Tax=Enterovibrio norvegicus TaxID=188144 RepID=A0A2N7LGZ3_9GAMM|nr:HAMP domain-containing sensor histidine kinase [Enterovibrio norvegicus]PMN94817.1 hypothetical protein BCT23_01945 [Enterovibrio norvegicus]
MNEKLISLVDESMHELRVFNQRLSTSISRLSQSTKTSHVGENMPLDCNPTHADEIRNYVNNISHLVKLSTIRIDFVDYELNPDFFSELEPYPIDIFNKFYANKVVLNSTCKNHKVKIKLHKPDCVLPYISAVRLIDILPFLLLDNAVKYSPNDCEVNVEFTLYGDEIEVVIKSIGPYVPQDEIKRLCTKSYRGKNAKVLSEVKGQGIGLYFADKIVKLHDARMDIYSSDNTFGLSNTRYSDFHVTLRFPTASC